MKIKWVAALAALAVLIGGGALWLTGEDSQPLPVKTLKAEEVAYTAGYAGRIESAESRGVYTDVPCIAGEVLVKAGQTVEKGDVLFTVDEEATRQVAATLDGYGEFGDMSLPDEVEMVAPVRGIISTLNVKKGEIANPDKPCVVISSGEALQVKLSVPEKALPRLFEGQKVTVSGVAFDKDSYAGTLTEIAPSARQQTSTAGTETVVDVTVTIHPEEIDSSLRVGLTADAAILMERLEDALVVPYEAIMQENNGQEYVYLLQDGCAKKTNITTDRATKNGVVVTEGLASGCRVITAPERVTEDGMAVTAA